MKSTWLLALSLALVSSVNAAPAKAPAEAKLELSTGSPKNKEEMVFSKDKLTAKAGSKVTVTFKNGSAAKGMMHNFVLVAIGKAQAVLDASISAGPAAGWVASTPDVLAKTKLLDAGESATVEFTAPTTPGDYPYVCTFPGHATMRGILKVTK